MIEQFALSLPAVSEAGGVRDEVQSYSVISVELYPATIIKEWLPKSVNDYGRAERLIWTTTEGCRYQATFAESVEFRQAVVDGLLMLNILIRPLGIEPLEASAPC